MEILHKLSKLLSILPGIGPRSSKRLIITLAQEKDTLKQLIALLQEMQAHVKKCKQCNNLAQGSLCEICNNRHRDNAQICIVSDIANLWAIEKTGQYDGLYHVLDESYFTKQNEYIDEELKSRITGEPQEFILAMNPTIQGQATVHYITSILKDYPHISVTTLALGIPMGSEIDYLDAGTITIAFNSRKEIR